MIYLLLSILTSTCIFIMFKLFAKNNVNIIQAIVVNYTVCVIVGLIVQGDFPSINEIVYNQWFTHALMIGGLFISVFYLTALTVKYSGVAVASIANKLSLIIPVIAAYFLYQDAFTILKIAGIIVAILSVIFAAYKQESEHHKHNFQYYFYPALVLLGGGVIDTFSKWNQEYFLKDTEFDLFLIFVFGTAAAIGWIILSYRYFYLKEKLSIKSLGYGIALGIPNYGSMAFLLAALNVEGWESSVVFPINNIAVVAASCLIAAFVFKEKLTKTNIVGIFLAIVAILLIIEN